MRAKHAEKHGDAAAQQVSHHSAHYSHKAAAVHAKGITKAYHETMAKFHGKRAGVKDEVLDAVEAEPVLDDAMQSGATAVGIISKDGVTIGRAFIAGDGKSMVYVGMEGDTRIKINGWEPRYTNDDETVPQMVQALVAQAVPAADDGTARYAAVVDDLVSRGWVIKNGEAGKNDCFVFVETGVGAFYFSRGKMPVNKYGKESGYVPVAEISTTDKTPAELAADIDAVAVAASQPEPQPEPAEPAQEETPVVNEDQNEGRDPLDVASDPDGTLIVQPGEKLAPVAKGDISYLDDGLFTTFLPNNADGEEAWRVINANPESEGGKVLSIHADSVIAQLRAAGYSIHKAKTSSGESDDALLNELLGNDAPALAEPTPEPVAETSIDELMDRKYLNSLIDGSGDLLAEDTFARLEPMFEKYPEGSETRALLEQAATVYGDAAVAAAQAALAG